jgi:hypothetical protein
MAAQADLGEVLARFDLKLAKMCPAGEKAEIDRKFFPRKSCPAGLADWIR